MAPKTVTQCAKKKRAVMTSLMEVIFRSLQPSNLRRIWALKISFFVRSPELG